MLRNATGAWLYLTDYALRNDGAGGLSMEGSQYASNGLGPLALAMYALHSAGQDDTARWGPQVSLAKSPFWTRMVPAYLAMLTPTPRYNADNNYSYLNPVYQPPLTGDLETYAFINDQFIKVLAPMALYDWRVNGTTGETVQAVRYIQRHLAEKGPGGLTARIRDARSSKHLRDAIYYFLVFDPAAPVAADPRPALQANTFWAQHDPAGKMGMVLGRSDATPAATYFHWHLAWNRIDHQRGDSLGFGLWKNGLWLTKIMTGYGLLQGCSDYRNAPSIQNAAPLADQNGGQANTQLQVDHGSQLSYDPMGDPAILARSMGAGFMHFDGDATNLYNSGSRPEVRAITHASRSLIWVKPDYVVVYDRAKTTTAGLFKRFYLNLPETPTIAGNVATSVAREGATAKAKLFVTSLLPLGAVPQAVDISSGQPSNGEDMKARVMVEAPGAPAETRFLQVVQSAEASAVGAEAAQLVQSSGGTPYDGAVVGTRAFFFKRDAATAFASLAYSVPVAVTQHFITGLAPFAPYTATFTPNGANTGVALATGGASPLYSDGGGVLILGGAEPVRVEIKASALSVLESGGAPVTFSVSRSGDVSAPLTVGLALETAISRATAADVSAIPSQVTIPAGSAVATFVVTPVADVVAEGAEDLVIALQPGAGFHVSEGGAAATVAITEVAPNAGKLQFSSAAFSVAENVASGGATISVTRSGGFEGAVSVQFAASAGTTDATDFTATGGTLNWADGESGAKTFVVAIANDATPESSETVALTLSAPSSPATLGATANATLTITDDDTVVVQPPAGDGGSGGSGGSGGGSGGAPGMLQFALAAQTVAENVATGSVQLTVTRTGGSAGAVSAGYYTLSYSATPSGDYGYKAGSLNWADGDASSRTITVPILDDEVSEGAEYFKVTLDNIAGGATYGANQTTQIDIVDDDIPPPVYEVGAGQALASLAEVPWTTLPKGAKVRLHWQAAPYKQKILISTRGTATQPITLEGVAGPNGELPVIDGTGATASVNLEYTPWFGDAMERSIIAVAKNSTQPATFKPGHIIIKGLEITMSGAKTPMPTYVKPDGTSANYYTSGGAIYLYGAEHVTIRDCVIHDVPNGIVSQANSSETTVPRGLTVEYCWIYNAGKGGAYHGNNLMTQGVGLVAQFNRLDRGLNGTNASNLVDRSAGTIIRYNRIEGGGKLVDLLEPVDSPAIITADPSFATSHVYGNVLLNGAGDYNTDGSNLVRYGGYYGSAAIFRAGTLHFHHNTVVVDSQRWSTTVFDVSLAAATVLADNNVLHHAKLSPSGGPFNVINSGRVVTLGRNWITAGYTVNGTAATGTALVLSGAMPGFANSAAKDFTPAAGSVLVDAALALPAGALPVDFVYVAEADGAARAVVGAAPDVGAWEKPN